ncbi:phage tail protein [Pseudomonas sp. ICMP 561]|uniref:phage tail protein n=1 Tax=Pseudomonas sp. ICMP 561 TaxID=1718918 RepID=UPI000C0A705B|nr:phage tail protein [Pseudomonas sp. ICMP 561]PHN29557.1 hypothetical protein AO242_20020 [Pseudomonas sp. ICMP 561]
MDFPKSVPNVGLVDGRFVDESNVTGQVGSLITADWGNAMTSEIINVIEAAELVPEEGNDAQLLDALNRIVIRTIPDAMPIATETDLGAVKLASVEETKTGTNKQKAVTPLGVHQAIDKKAVTGSVFRKVISSKTLLSSDLGLVVVDATEGVTSVTLPAATPVLGVRDVIVRRMDNTDNRLIVVAGGDDRIKMHTHLNAAGYPFLVLMGAGDWWHLRSDGAGSWWPVGRSDSTPLGRIAFDSTTVIPSGGYGPVSGSVFIRAEWPWLWDHAQQSGMLTTEAGRVGMEGGWTSGDGVATFRGPEARGEFFRVLDDTRAVDISRVAGSSQAASEILSGGAEGRSADVRNYDKRTAVSDSRLTGSSTSAAHHWDAIRPRNIAYPGRIKLI